MMPGTLSKCVRTFVLGAAAIIGVSAHGAPVNVDFCVKEGQITLADGAIVPIWGFVERIPPLGCGHGAHAAQLPGPVIRAQPGDVVTIQVRNRLSVNTSILIPGQDVSVISPGNAGEFTGEAKPGTNFTKYQFTAKAGTYIYESGTDPAIQVPMGLHGALVVESGNTDGGGAPLAYSGNATAYDREAVLVLSEIDANLNNNPGGFDLQNYAPTYWLINGRSFPEIAGTDAWPGDRVLLRYVNAGFTHHAMATLGLHQNIVARDAFELPTVVRAVAETVPAGTTADMIPVVPGNAGAMTTYHLYNRNARLTNGGANDAGGMHTGVDVQPLYFSTFRNATVPGVGPGGANAYDDADLYKWNGQRFTREWEARQGSFATDLLGTADVDGMKVVDADTFYVSFANDNTTIPDAIGAVNDEDVVLYDAGVWTVYFDGSTVGLDVSDGLDIDAFDIDLATDTIYFSTAGNDAVGALGPGDDSDIYSWSSGGGFARVWDASAAGGVIDPPGAGANVDGLDYIAANDFRISFDRNFGVPLPGGVLAQDEDVIAWDGATFSILFDGSSVGLDAPPQPHWKDIDAFDLP